MSSSIDQDKLNTKKETPLLPSPDPDIKREKTGPAAPTPVEDEEAKKKALAEAGKLVGLRIFKFADTSDKVMLTIGTIASFLAGAGMPAYTEINGRIIGNLSATSINETMANLAIALIVVGAAMFILNTTRIYCFKYSAQRQTSRIRLFYFSSILRQEVAWHDVHPPGELTSRMDGDGNVIERAIGENFSTAIMHIGTVLFGFAVAFWRGWELTLLMVGALPITVGVAAAFGKIMVNQTRRSREGYAVAGAMALEAIDNIKTVQIFGRENYEADKFSKAVAPAAAAGIKREFATQATTGLTLFILYIIYGVGFWFAAYLVLWDRMNVGKVITVFFASLMASFSMGLLSPCVGVFLEGAGAAGKIFEIIDRKPLMDATSPPTASNTQLAVTAKSTNDPFAEVVVSEKEEQTGCVLPDGKFKNEIAFTDVAFSYPTRPDDKLFTKLNLTIKKGQTVAFSGASGSGKSSIVGLLQRFYDPISGSVSVDGIDMKDLNLRAWRDCISIVSQEPKLFTGTVAENVRIGKPDATLEDVIAACTKAHVNHVIEALPKKYDTLVGTGGSQLSGGQKQRIAIARALLRNPQILILDEATSALDRKSEVEVQAALEDVMFGGRHTQDGKDDPLTVIVIAHRLATIRNADVIHYINHDGEQGSWIEESGSYDELIKLNGHFATMTRKQTRASADDAGSARQKSTAEMIDSVFEEEKKKQAAKEQKQMLTKKALEVNESQLAAVAGMKEEAAVGGAKALIGRKRKPKVNPDDASSYYSSSDDEDDGNESDGKLYKKAKKRTLKEIDDEAVKATPVPYLRVLGLCKGDRWAIAIACFGCLGAGIVNPAYAVVFAYILQVLAEFETDESIINNKIPIWCSMFFVVAFVALICNFLLAFFAVAGENLTLKIRRALFYSILRQDMTFFDTPGRDSSALATILSTDTEIVHGLWGPKVGTYVRILASLGGGIVIGMCYSWRCSLVVLATLPSFGIAVAVGTFAKPIEQDDDLSSKAEALTNIRTVISLNLQGTMLQRYVQHTSTLEKKQRFNSLITGISAGLVGFVTFGVMALVNWYSGKLITDGDNSFLDVMIAQIAVLMGMRGLADADGMGSRFKDAGGAAQRVFYIIDRMPSISAAEPADLTADFDKEGVIKNANTSAIPMDGKGPSNNQYSNLEGIELKDLRFRYPARIEAPLLRGVSLDLEIPKTYGLMGETGCGKSTLIGLLARFYDPAGGALTILTKNNESLEIAVAEKDSKDLTTTERTPLPEANLAQWRSNISLVLQEPSLFSGTIRENILYSRPEATDEEVEQAAKHAAIHDDIMLMPNNYKTDVGYKGQALSGGQKQRVAIARALLRKPKLLLMDEATSALDNATEGRVEQGLKAACEENEMIVVSVAHRLTTIKDSDCIAVMEEGKLKEKGSHDELVALGGHYKERWELFANAAELQRQSTSQE